MSTAISNPLGLDRDAKLGKYLIEYQVFIWFLPTISGRKWSGEIRQKPVYKVLLLKVGNGRKKILYFVGISRVFLLRLR